MASPPVLQSLNPFLGTLNPSISSVWPGTPPMLDIGESLNSCEKLLSQRRFFQNYIRFPSTPARQRGTLLPNMVEECLRNWCDSVWLPMRFSTQTEHTECLDMLARYLWGTHTLSPSPDLGQEGLLDKVAGPAQR